MRRFLMCLTLCSGLLSYGAATATGAWPGQPAWADLFPAPPANYYIAFKPPVVAKSENPEVYHLSVVYDWLGNDFRSATATLARDPEFKTKYAAEAMKKEGAKEITVGRKTAWVRPAKKESKWEYELVVPLSEDKALILASQGHFGGEVELSALAARFDLEQVEKALAKAPAVERKKD